MSGLLTRGGEENVPGIPGACATRNFYVSGKEDTTDIVAGQESRDKYTNL